MKAEPRVVFFTDSYLEVNGVARTSRQFAEFAAKSGLPFLCIHAGPKTEKLEEGSLTRLALERTPVGFQLDADLRYDFLFWRHLQRTIETVRSFKADLVHLTGPNDVCQLGAYVAHKLRLPVVISWHTNLHQYAGRRLNKLTRFLPDAMNSALINFAEQQSLRAVMRFYQIGRVLLAPNEELGELVEQNCKKPTFIMRRGVDIELFSPAKRDRHDDVFTLGYVGRLSTEKNVRFLATLEKSLLQAGVRDFRFIIVGTGSERSWLEQNIQCATFTGVLKGEALARVYANLDLFIFPSQTDTFGNVILEAQASGVPAIVSAQGGPKFIIRDQVTGVVANDERDFVEAIVSLKSQPERLQQMREASRQLACAASWDAVFEQVYQAYAECLKRIKPEHAVPKRVRPSIASPDAAR